VTPASPSDPSASELTDAELVRRAKEGEASAFDTLILRYQGALYGVLYNIVLNHADAEDLLMESLLKAYRSLPNFRGDASFYTWLYRIAYNLALNHRSKRRTYEKVVEPQAVEEPELDPTLQAADPKSDTVQSLVGKELENKLNECLARLSDDHRAVVTFYDIQGLSHAEIASVMKCSEGTIRSRLHHAHKLLQKMLQSYISPE
jgi:RNA polymerase sigma-70 factor, ECF subfamily